MAEPKCRTQGKIQATRQWLNRAEEHFGRNAPVRGQLDLLLAEAELRSTREYVENGPGKIKQQFFQQAVAFGLASILVVAGMGGAWWWYEQAPKQTLANTHATPPSLAVPAVLAPIPDKSAMGVTKSEPAPVTVVDTNRSVQEVKTEQQSVGNKPELAPEEMKRLIQAAGQSLRGRTKQ